MSQEKFSLPVNFFSERLQKATHGVSQSGLAQALGIGQSNVSMYLRGDRIPSLDVFYKLCRALGVSADWLLGLKGNDGAAVTATNSTVAAFGGAVSGGDCSRCPLMLAAREALAPKAAAGSRARKMGGSKLEE